MIIAERRVVAGRASLPVPFQTLPGCGGPADPGLAPPRPAPPSTSCGLAPRGHTNTLCGPGCGAALKMAQGPSQE